MRHPLSHLLLAAVLAATATSGRAEEGDDDDDSCGPAGSSRLLASMPPGSSTVVPTGPTYPEGIAVLGRRVVTSGPANFGTAGNGSPSQLTVFDRHSGALLGQVPVVGEDLTQEHALSELYRWKDSLYAPSTQLGVLRWKGPGAALAQENYSTPFCSVTGGFPCHVDSDRCPADVRPGLPPLPNGIVVAADGEVFVADSLQGIVWRIPRGGKPPIAPQVLFCSRKLQGSGDSGLSLFGANGVAVIGDRLYVSDTFGPLTPTGPSSVVYRLPRRHPTQADLTAVFSYPPTEVAPGVFVPALADGLRVNPDSGHLFVVLAGISQVSELDVSGAAAVEVARYSRNTPDHPFKNPSTIAFSPDGHTAYVSNHAITCCMPDNHDPSCLCSGAPDYFGVIELCL